MNSHNITIVNAAHHLRLNGLKRTFKYFKDFSCDKICVLSDIKNINFDTYGFNVIEYDGNHVIRMTEALNLVKTKYVIQVSEDDIYNIDYILEAIQFLEDNEDYVSAHGISLRFNENNPEEINHPSQDPWVDSYYKIYTNQNRDKFYSKDPFKRLDYYSHRRIHPSSMCQNVIRTNIVTSLYNFLIKYTEYQSFSYLDRIQIVHHILLGNIKLLNVVHVLRNDGKKVGQINALEPGLETKEGHFNMIFTHSDKFCEFLHEETNIDISEITDNFNKTIINWSAAGEKKISINVEVISKLLQNNATNIKMMLNKYLD